VVMLRPRTIAVVIISFFIAIFCCLIVDRLIV